MEAHRARTPGVNQGWAAGKYAMVHGVLLNASRQRQEVWFTREDIGIWASIERITDMIRCRVRDSDGCRQVCQIYHPKRSTQTRGISVLAPAFDAIGIHDDIEFAELVRRQVSACFAFFRKRPVGWKGNDGTPLGDVQETQGREYGVRRAGGVAPGMELTGEEGEEISGFCPNIPGGDYLPHMRSILQMIFVNLGLPLSMALMDTKDTNFSGARSESEQAKLGFKGNQRMLIRQFHVPTWQWLVRQWMAEDLAMSAKAKAGTINPLVHRWNTPAWPYIEPLKDAQADAYELSNLLTSPRRRNAERDCEGIEEETVDDRAKAIIYAKKAALRVNEAVDDNTPITWRDLLPLPMPAGVKVAAAETLPGGDEDAESAPPAKSVPPQSPGKKTPPAKDQ
jgi:capsid protein